MLQGAFAKRDTREAGEEDGEVVEELKTVVF
jgi:hypothetical protein